MFVEKRVSFIIAVYDCSGYIMDCVNSIVGQNKPSGWLVDFRIGVDGCIKTSAILTRNKIKHYFSPRNVGAYIMRNSLIALGKSDAYAYFDADDVAGPSYISTSIRAMARTGIVLTGKYQADEKLKIIKTSGAEKGGAMTFTHEIWEAVGGFYGYRCAADTDFMKRVEMAGYSIELFNQPLYYRRRHAKSLTKAVKTGMGSPYRKKAWKEMCDKRAQGIIKIKPTVVELEER